MVVIRTVPEQSALTQQYVNQLRNDIEGWLGNQSDPLYYAIEFIVQQQRIITELLNESGIALAVGLASGTDLNQIIPLPRQEAETDVAFRSRFASLLQAHSGDTDEFIIRHVLTQAGILGAQVIRLPGYAVDIYVLAEAQTGFEAFNTIAKVVAAAQVYMNGTSIKPWFSQYTVTAADEELYQVGGDIVLTRTADIGDVRSRVQTALTSIMAELRKLNVGVYDSRVTEAIWQPEFVDCDLTIELKTDNTYATAKTEYVSGTYTIQTTAVSAAGQVQKVSNTEWYFYPHATDLPLFFGVEEELDVEIRQDATNRIRGTIKSASIHTLTDVLHLTFDTPLETNSGVLDANKIVSIAIQIDNNSFPPVPNKFYTGRVKPLGWNLRHYGEDKGADGNLVPSTP